MVLPPRGRARERGDRSQGKAAGPREAPLQANVSARAVDQAERLVEPDRDAWPQHAHDPSRRACLGLRQAARARVFRIAAAAGAAPSARKVPVEVDAPRVLARAARRAVRVEVADHPQLGAGGSGGRHEAPGDRLARRLVAVDGADHEHLARRRGVADARGGDAPTAHRAPQFEADRRGRPRAAGEASPVAAHGRLAEVAVRAVRERADALVVVGAREALGVPDHVPRPDAEAVLQPPRESQRRRKLAPVAHDVAVADAHVLDADGRPVQADRVTAHQAQRDELVDGAVARDQEVRTDAGALVQLHVRRIRGERVEGRLEAPRRGEVLDDHLRIGQAVRVDAVVPAGVAPHLALALASEWNRVLDDGRPYCLVLRLNGGVRRRGRHDDSAERHKREHDLAPLRTNAEAHRLASVGVKRRFLV